MQELQSAFLECLHTIEATDFVESENLDPLMKVTVQVDGTNWTVLVKPKLKRKGDDR